jgi:hypothetical protein
LSTALIVAAMIVTAMKVTAMTVTAQKVTAMKASFLRVAVAGFEGSLARHLKLCFHILKLQLQFLREVSHESLVFTCSTFSL